MHAASVIADTVMRYAIMMAIVILLSCSNKHWETVRILGTIEEPVFMTYCIIFQRSQ